MDCSFSGVLVSNVVTGANNQATVTITGTLTCSSGTARGSKVSITSSQLTQTVNPDPSTGAFTFTIPNVPCGSPFNFTLSGLCSDQATPCKPPPYSLSIQCPPPVTCPLKVTLDATATCNASGNYDVTYTASFSPPIPQGATGVLFWDFGGVDVLTGQSSAMTTLTGTAAVSQLTQSATLAPNSNGYIANVNLALNGSYSSCPPISAMKQVPALPPCTTTPCPSSPQGPVTITMQLPQGWCAPATAAQGQIATLTAQINWPASVTNPPTPLQYNWTITTPGQVAATQISTTNQVGLNPGWSGAGSNVGGVDLSGAGTYSVAVTPVFDPNDTPLQPNGQACDLTGTTTFTLQACQNTPTCPSISNLSASVGCFDPANGAPVLCTCTATAQDPSGIATGFSWDFGDPGTPGDQQITTAPAASHSYSRAGSFTVTVTAQTPAGCSQPASASQTVTVNVSTCACPPGQTRGSDGKCTSPKKNGNGIGCGLLSVFGIALLTLGLLALLLFFCMAPVPPLNGILLGAAAVLGGLGIVLLVIWAILCPKPCGWFLLMPAQLCLGLGWVGCYFGFGACCPWLGVLSIGLLILSAGLYVAWIKLCDPTGCDILKQIALPLTAVVIPTIAALLAVAHIPPLIPIFAPLILCTNWIVAAILSLVDGIIATAALLCT